MSLDNRLKIVDVVVFLFLFGLGGYTYLGDYLNLFDAVSIIAMLYILIRKRDVNTVTLVLILLSVRLLEGVVFYDYAQINAYVFYSAQTISNVIVVGLIWSRPSMICKLGPKFIQDNKNLAVTQQDLVMGFLFGVQALFHILAFLEHLSRHLDDIGLDKYVDVQWWSETSRFIYNNYQAGQLMFSVVGLLILYFMTFDASKVVRHKDHESAQH